MAMPVPPKLKPVTQYVRRAENLDRAPEPEAPVVAYYCRLYATEQAMKLQDKSEEGKVFLTAMMDRLEDDAKKGMGQFTQEEGRKMTYDWALKDFNAADEEDRAGLADQGTARTFYAAGVFFDVLRQFGEPDEETSRRRVYCKWKASQILKAIKEGRTPTPGGAGEDVQTGMPSVGGGGGGGGYQPPASAPEETKQHDPLAGIIPEAPTTKPLVDPAVAAADAADTDAPVPSTRPYEPPSQPHYGGPEAPSPAYSTGDVPPGGGQSPYAPASAPYVAPEAPYVAPEAPYVAPEAPYVAPASPYVAPPAPAPAPAPAAPAPAAARPRYSPAPARPKTPVPLPSGSRRSGGGGGRGGKPMEGNMADAMEHCRYAIRALEHKDVALAVQKLQEALQQIT